LNYGDGHRRTADTLPPVIQSVVPSVSGNSAPFGLTVAPDGSSYGVVGCCVVKKFAPNGTSSVVAGTTLVSTFAGDGGPATSATLGPAVANDLHGPLLAL